MMKNIILPKYKIYYHTEHKMKTKYIYLEVKTVEVSHYKDQSKMHKIIM